MWLPQCMFTKGQAQGLAQHRRAWYPHGLAIRYSGEFTYDMIAPGLWLLKLGFFRPKRQVLFTAVVLVPLADILLLFTYLEYSEAQPRPEQLP